LTDRNKHFKQLFKFMAHSPTAKEKKPAVTRLALIEAAGPVFAELGFRDATVREICDRAKANVAAINYHFRDKEGLYLEVLKHYQEFAAATYPASLGLDPKASAATRLHAFVRSFLLRIFDQGPVAIHAKLMAREMVEPTAALDILVQERLRPQAQEIGRIVAGVVGKDPTDELVRLCTFSVVSQCLFYHHCRPVIQRLFPKQKLQLTEVDRLAEHITEFSLAGLKKLGRKVGG
jgi:AcrR family transcriptional regulator